MAIGYDPLTRFVPNALATKQGGYRENIGFFEGIAASYESSVVGHSKYGDEQALQELEDENIRLAAEAGVEVSPLNAITEGVKTVYAPWTGYERYTDFQRQATEYDNSLRQSGKSVDIVNRQAQKRVYDERVARNDELFKRAAALRPDLNILTYDDMHARIAKTAQEAEARARKSSIASQIVGGIGAGFNLSTSEFNLLNVAPVGAGRTIIARVLSQSAIAAGGEAAEQFTGGRETALNLGIQPRTGVDIALAAAGGAAFQGVLGEAVPAVLRRFRAPRTSPPPPAVPSPPPGAAGPPPVVPAVAPPIRGPEAVGLRQGVQFVFNDVLGTRTVGDRVRAGIYLDHTARGLDVWGAVSGDIAPPTAIVPAMSAVRATTRPVLGQVIAPEPMALPPSWQRVASLRDPIPGTVDRANLSWLDTARRFDPDTFKEFEALKRALTQAQEAVKTAKGLGQDRMNKQRVTLNKVIARLQEAMERTRSPQGQAKLMQEIAELEAAQRIGAKRDKASLEKIPAKYRVTANVNKVAEIKARMAELEPAVNDAFAKSKGLWVNELSDIERAYLGRPMPEPKRVTKVVGQKAPFDPGKAIPDINELRSPHAAEGGKNNESVVETVNRVHVAELKDKLELDEKFVKDLQKFMTEAPKLAVKERQELLEQAIMSDGTPVSKALDMQVGETLDGKPITLRHQLEELSADDEAFAAFSSCVLGGF